jgi:hypothetical protein
MRCSRLARTEPSLSRMHHRMHQWPCAPRARARDRGRGWLLLAAMVTAVGDGGGAERSTASARTWSSRGRGVASDGAVVRDDEMCCGAHLCRCHSHSSTVHRVVSASLQLRGGGRVPASMKRMRQKEAREQVRAPGSTPICACATTNLCTEREIAPSYARTHFCTLTRADRQIPPTDSVAHWQEHVATTTARAQDRCKVRVSILGRQSHLRH